MNPKSLVGFRDVDLSPRHLALDLLEIVEVAIEAEAEVSGVDHERYRALLLHFRGPHLFLGELVVACCDDRCSRCRKSRSRPDSLDLTLNRGRSFFAQPTPTEVRPLHLHRTAFTNDPLLARGPPSSFSQPAKSPTDRMFSARFVVIYSASEHTPPT